MDEVSKAGGISPTQCCVEVESWRDRQFCNSAVSHDSSETISSSAGLGTWGQRGVKETA